MALNERFIADTSALSRMKAPAVGAVLGPLVASGDVATCAMVEMEVLFSAIGANDLSEHSPGGGPPFVGSPSSSGTSTGRST